MPEFRTIKQLVVETCIAEGGFPSSERLNALVKQHFPQSRWNNSPETHYPWYKAAVRTGRIEVPGFSPDRTVVDDDEEISTEVEDLLEARVSLEKDLHSYLVERVNAIEPGLVLVEGGVEYETDAGRVDLLAKDAENHLVVIELKAGRAGDAALGQLLGYMGCLSAPETKVRGLLVASAFDRRVVHAAKGLPQVKLLKYQLSFKFEPYSDS